MPDRIVREGILESDAVNSLSWAGEVFYRRLINVVDDYGNFHGKPELILAKLYPLKLDRVSIADIGKWLTECVGAGLVSRYEVQGKPYVCIEKFDQKGLKRKVSKFPNKAQNARVVPDSVQKRREVEYEEEVEEKSNYTRPKDFLKSVNEIELNEVAMKSGLGAEWDACLEQWDLSIQGGDFAYSGNNSEDYRRLMARLQKWVNSWVSNNRNRPQQKNANASKAVGIMDAVEQVKRNLNHGNSD